MDATRFSAIGTPARPAASIRPSASMPLRRSSAWYEPGSCRIPSDGLDHEACDLAGVLLEHRPRVGLVVVVDDDGIARDRPRHAGTARRAERQRAAAGRDEQAVDVPMVAPDALHHQVAPGGGP